MNIHVSVVALLLAFASTTLPVQAEAISADYPCDPEEGNRYPLVCYAPRAKLSNLVFVPNLDDATIKVGSITVYPIGDGTPVTILWSWGALQEDGCEAWPPQLGRCEPDPLVPVMGFGLGGPTSAAELWWAYLYVDADQDGDGEWGSDLALAVVIPP